jgi:Holliday junction DNA helicase RuvA
MISRLTGKLIAKTATEAVIDCNGIGFSAFITLATYDRLPEIGEEVSLITHLIPRDDSLNLYGFYDVVERDAFLQLISISGVGAKTAIAVLSALSVAELQQFIISGNSPALQKLQGIGKKTAERIILELKDKISKLQVGEEALLPGTISDTVRQEAVMALVSLGYTNTAAEKAVKKVLADVSGDITVESLIRLVLKNTGK